MNFCLLYAGFWLAELLLYYLGWSDLNVPLVPDLLLLIVTTIIISIIWGYKCRHLFNFKYIENPKSLPNSSRIKFIIITYILEFVYCKQIPLFSILSGTSEYTSYTGIPVIHILLVTYACYYSFYCYYLYEATGNKKYRQYTIIIAILHLLVFSRASIMILLFIITAVKISKKGGITRALNPKFLIVLIFAVSVVLFVFGVLGNLRCGSQWNDSSIIDAIGMYNEHYPSFLPSQYKWAYTYITSPLANLNNGLLINGVSYDLEYYLISFIPDFISKRLFPDYLYMIPDTRIVLDLNAVSGYYNFFYFGGFFGALFMFIVLVGGSISILSIFDFPEGQGFTFLMIASELVFFLFFYNVIYLSQCSFCLVYPLLTLITKKVKFKLY